MRDGEKWHMFGSMSGSCSGELLVGNNMMNVNYDSVSTIIQLKDRLEI